MAVFSRAQAGISMALKGRLSCAKASLVNISMNHRFDQITNPSSASISRKTASKSMGKSTLITGNARRLAGSVRRLISPKNTSDDSVNTNWINTAWLNTSPRDFLNVDCRNDFRIKTPDQESIIARLNRFAGNITI
jgi:hypothetical protein